MHLNQNMVLLKNPDTCTYCGLCAKKCLVAAIVLQEDGVTPPILIEQEIQATDY